MLERSGIIVTDELARLAITHLISGKKRSNKLQDGVEKIKKLDDIAKLFGDGDGLSQTSRARNPRLRSLMLDLIKGCKGRDVSSSHLRLPADHQDLIPQSAPLLSAVEDHPRTFFQEDYATNNPAALMYACEGLDIKDLDFPDNEDEEEIAERLSRIQQVEDDRRSMFYTIGCEVSLLVILVRIS